MDFVETVITDDIRQLRQKLLNHSLWDGIEAGTLGIPRLQQFALQDWWLVREAYRLDALAIASTNELEIQDLLISKLTPKMEGYKLLLRFGEAIGLSQVDFNDVKPLAGCMALTNFFFWILAYGSLGEKLAAVARVKTALFKSASVSVLPSRKIMD
jgi:pyrroloquinoline-quinone synthase